MARPYLNTTFFFALLAIAFFATASDAQDTPCSFTISILSCQCSGTSLTCSRWPKSLMKQIPSGTTALTITGSNTRHLKSNQLPFNHLPNLRTLDLTNNSIIDIQARWFSQAKFPALEELILDNNKLTLSESQIFVGTSEKLRILSLNGALVRNHTVVTNLGGVLKQGNLSNLEEIHLDNNELGLLDTTLFNFSGSTTLQKITLFNTSLIAIIKGTFLSKSFPHLRYLDLSSNELTSMDQKTVNDFQTFTDLTVNLSGNPFFCNCKLAHFQAWLVMNTTTVADKTGLLCADAFLKSSVNKPIVDAVLECADPIVEVNIDDGLHSSYIILSVILTLVSLLALVVLYMRRNDIKDYFVDFYTTSKEAFNSRQGYDAISRVRRETPEMSPTEV